MLLLLLPQVIRLRNEKSRPQVKFSINYLFVCYEGQDERLGLGSILSLREMYIIENHGSLDAWNRIVAFRQGVIYHCLTGAGMEGYPSAHPTSYNTAFTVFIPDHWPLRVFAPLENVEQLEGAGTETRDFIGRGPSCGQSPRVYLV